jgi:hypothetical protein
MLIPSNTDQRRRITIAEAEAEHTPTGQEPERIRRFPALAKPFGFQNDVWEALKAQMQAGDELWEYCTDRGSWQQLMGSAGIVLIRDGEVVASITTLMN